MGTANS